MAPRRLSDNDKQELVGRYKSGESTAALADAFGCSPNTVTRTVKALLPAEAYAALKVSRQRMPVAVTTSLESEPIQAAGDPEDASDEDTLADDSPSSLALADAEDFGGESADEEDSEDAADIEPVDPDAVATASDPFLELVPLTLDQGLGDHSEANPIPLSVSVLPTSAYMLVDKVVELDARPLREFPDMGSLSAAEQELKGLYLYASPRAAKRQCNRNQRVIKVPDTEVFVRTSSFLLARGITRLVLDGTLIALDSDQSS